MPGKNTKPNLDSLVVGDRIVINLHGGRTAEAVIKAVVPTTMGLKFQVAYGNDLTALVEGWRVIERV